MDLETPLPSSKMYHAAPAPGGGSSANPPGPARACIEGGHFLDWRDCTPLDGRHWTRRQPRPDDRTSSQPGSDEDEAIGRK